MTNGISWTRRARRPFSIRLAVTAALTAGVALCADAATAGTIFSTGPFTLPEAITPGSGATYIISDADNDAVYQIPSGGGAPTASQSLGFRVFGEISLTGFYGALQGTYLAYGTDDTSSEGIASLVGSNGLGLPSNVITAPNGWFTGAIVASSAFGTAAAGQIILANETAGDIESLNADLSGTTVIASLDTINSPFGIGFAAQGFGAEAGNLFVSDSSTGNLYTVDSSGNETLFAALPLPRGFVDPGLRQFAWAPAGFGQYGGDLFVSVAAQNGGGGSTGEIDVLDANGQTVALYAQGNGAVPLDPRGLMFVNDTTLLVSNADPGVDALSPNDFLPASDVLGVPEPGSAWLLATGLAALFGLGRWVARRRHQPEAVGQADGVSTDFLALAGV